MVVGNNALAPNRTRLCLASSASTTPIAEPASAIRGRDLAPTSSIWRINSRHSNPPPVAARSTSQTKAPSSPNHSNVSRKGFDRAIPDDELDMQLPPALLIQTTQDADREVWLSPIRNCLPITYRKPTLHPLPCIKALFALIAASHISCKSPRSPEFRGEFGFTGHISGNASCLIAPVRRAGLSVRRRRAECRCQP